MILLFNSMLGFKSFEFENSAGSSSKQSGNFTPTLQIIKDYLVTVSPAARFFMSEV